jgi:3-hydroxybutyryl-CoA dehydrogenase
MRYQVIQAGESRSFHRGHAFIAGAAETGEVVVVVGVNAGAAFRDLADRERKTAILIELGTECLGVHTGEARGEEGSNVLGFARFRMGDAEPSNLVELVRQPRTSDTALAAAREVFERAGLKVSICGDFAGRIIDRLVRPYYNAALRRLDERLASAHDLDATLKLGLGYPEGPIELLERTGLAHHHDVTQALFEACGDPAYAPARRARVAKQRQQQGTAGKHE